MSGNQKRGLEIDAPNREPKRVKLADDSGGHGSLPTPISNLGITHNPAAKVLSYPAETVRQMNTPAKTLARKGLKLSLEIPKSPSPDANKRRSIAACKVADRKHIPRLQDPFPSENEIIKARNLKLLRDYSNPRNSNETGFIKPVIQKSARVSNLLKQFPKLDAITSKTENVQSTPLELLRNKAITRSRDVTKSAWKNFSGPEYGKWSFIESGLDESDMIAEKNGLRNNLPEWRKHKTGIYCEEGDDRDRVAEGVCRA